MSLKLSESLRLHLKLRRIRRSGLRLGWTLSLALTLTLPLRATVYFVDNQKGSDSNTGTSTNAPWAHLPGDPAATGTPASAKLSADTLYLKGGTIYRITSSSGVIVDANRYNPGTGVTISSGSRIGWGAGRAVFDGAGIGAHWFRILGMTRMTLQDLEMQNTVNDDGDASLFFYNSSSNLIDSCWIHDVGTNSASCHVDCVEFSGAGGYNVVTNCRVYNATQKCIETHDTCVGNIFINNFCWSAADHVFCISSDLNKVCGNVISNGAIAVVSLRQPTDPGYGIKLSSSSTTTCRSNLVFNNVVAHCNGAYINDNVGTQDMIYNRCFNNTFIDCGYGQSSPMGMITFNASSSGKHHFSEIRNNIFYIEQPIAGWLPAGIRVTGTQLGNSNSISHNLWATAAATLYPMISVNGTQQPYFTNFADGGTQSPDYRFANPLFGSGNSFAGAVNQLLNVDPKFKQYPANLALATNSPCIGAGTNLSSYFTTDISGATRSTWSIGAFESGATLPPAPPTGLHVVGP
jgi:hypothetical protein